MSAPSKIAALMLALGATVWLMAYRPGKEGHWDQQPALVAFIVMDSIFKLLLPALMGYEFGKALFGVIFLIAGSN